MDTSHFHPMVVHFPIALLMVGFAADFISIVIKKEKSFSKMGTYLLVLGILGCFAAYLTGEFFTKEYQGEMDELKELHEVISKVAMFAALAAAIIRYYLIYKKKDNTNLKWIVLAFYFVAVVFIGYTGYLGGVMVYNHLITP